MCDPPLLFCVFLCCLLHIDTILSISVHHRFSSSKLLLTGRFVFYCLIQMCALHSMACMLAERDTCVTDTAIFSDHSNAGLNKVLQAVYGWLAEQDDESRYVVLNKATGKGHTLVKGASSHSTRMGGALIANRHPDVEINDVGYAGGWCVEKAAKIFVYLKATEWGIAKVGRALAGWQDATQGGYAPSIEAIAVDDQADFRSFCLQFFSFPADWMQELKDLFGLVFLLHRAAFFRDYPDLELWVRFHSIIPAERLTTWEAVVVQQFQQCNALHYGQEVTMSIREALMDQKQERQQIAEVGCILTPVVYNL